MNPRFHRWLLLTFALLVPHVGWAEDDEDEAEDEQPSRALIARQTPAWRTYVAECGSCHLAFPPSMLPTRSWRALLGGLADHFGQNAELDAATRQTLERFLVAQAGREEPGPTPLRITQLRWWVHEHDEVPASVFQRKSVMSRANCAACHAGANEGAFEEHQVKIPRDAPAPR